MLTQQITARQLQRLACLYVRQSTLQQVFENTESTARQYALRERALALGWPAEPTDDGAMILRAPAGKWKQAGENDQRGINKCQGPGGGLVHGRRRRQRNQQGVSVRALRTCAGPRGPSPVSPEATAGRSKGKGPAAGHAAGS